MHSLPIHPVLSSDVQLYLHLEKLMAQMTSGSLACLMVGFGVEQLQQLDTINTVIT